MRGEFLDLSDARIYYYAAGTRGAGEPIVFIHGFPTSSHLWSGVVPLAPAGHRLVVLDLLGFGRSDRPVGRGLSIADHAMRLIELLDTLGIERACLVGHGIGGGIAQMVAVQHPARVSRLCLVDSVAFDAWPPLDAKIARALAPLGRIAPPAMILFAVRAALLRGYADRDRGTHSVDLYLRPFASPAGRDVLLRHLVELRNRDTATVSTGLASIDRPTAIVWGERDPFLPVTLARRLHDAIRGSTLDIVPDAGHFAPEEAAGRIGDILGALMKR